MMSRIRARRKRIALRFVSRGFTNQQIAKEMGLSKSTIDRLLVGERGFRDISYGTPSTASQKSARAANAVPAASDEDAPDSLDERDGDLDEWDRDWGWGDMTKSNRVEERIQEVKIDLRKEAELQALKHSRYPGATETARAAMKDYNLTAAYFVQEDISEKAMGKILTHGKDYDLMKTVIRSPRLSLDDLEKLTEPFLNRYDWNLPNGNRIPAKHLAEVAEVLRQRLSGELLPDDPVALSEIDLSRLHEAMDEILARGIWYERLDVAEHPAATAEHLNQCLGDPDRRIAAAAREHRNFMAA